jgi:hypothetical protein
MHLFHASHLFSLGAWQLVSVALHLQQHFLRLTLAPLGGQAAVEGAVEKRLEEGLILWSHASSIHTDSMQCLLKVDVFYLFFSNSTPPNLASLTDKNIAIAQIKFTAIGI